MTPFTIGAGLFPKIVLPMVGLYGGACPKGMPKAAGANV